MRGAWADQQLSFQNEDTGPGDRAIQQFLLSVIRHRFHGYFTLSDQLHKMFNT
jgi:hypothetical protein